MQFQFIHLTVISHRRFYLHRNNSIKKLSCRQYTSFHATGCHFTGPVALRPRLSSGLPISLLQLLNVCKKLVLSYFNALL